jgi:hypothetical protein
MFILQNLKDFIDNPMGKGSMAIPNRQLIRSDLNRRYDNLVRKKKITYRVYSDKEDYYFHFKIPSESERNNDYDVVIMFTYDEDKDFSYDHFLNRYYLKFFSNCPSFIFTYAFSFNLYGMFIESLSNKYDDRVLTEDPIVRNPGEIISYEKSIYFACYYLSQNRNLLTKSYLDLIALPYKEVDFNRLIRTSDNINLEIKKEQNRLDNEKKKEKEKLDQIKQANKKQASLTYGNNGSHRISKIGKITPKKKITPKTSTIKHK